MNNESEGERLAQKFFQSVVRILIRFVKLVFILAIDQLQTLEEPALLRTQKMTTKSRRKRKS